jgi:hypothetical protein
MPESKDPIVYRFTGPPGSGLTGIPARSLRQSDVDAMDADQKRLLQDHVEAEHLKEHFYKAVEAPDKAADKAADKAPEKASEKAPDKAGAKAADQQKGDGEHVAR